MGENGILRETIGFDGRSLDFTAENERFYAKKQDFTGGYVILREIWVFYEKPIMVSYGR